MGRPTNQEAWMKASREERKEIIAKRLEGVGEAEKAQLLRTAMAQLAALDDSPESFGMFYEVVHGRPIPRHAFDRGHDIVGQG